MSELFEVTGNYHLNLINSYIKFLIDKGTTKEDEKSTNIENTYTGENNSASDSDDEDELFEQFSKMDSKV